MIVEYIIGREGNQKFTIDDKQFNAVSRRHARMVVDGDTGEWRLSDNDSTNGTFIVDGKGDLQRVTREIKISPTTRICLGGKRYNALTVPAHIVHDGGSKGFAMDFDALVPKLKEWKQREKKKQNEMKVRRVMLALLPILAMVIPIPGMNDQDKMWVRMASVSAVSLLNAMLAFFENPKELMEERRRTIVCPKCGLPLTDEDVESHHCSRCKAH